ncbi:MAG: DUF4386 domain-containing protein [Hyphomonadaceae bacterium]
MMITAQAAQNTARIGGLAYLAIFVLAILANFIVFQPLGVKGDAVATAANIAASEPVYRAGVAAFLAVLIADLIVGWALFVVLRPVNESLSLLALIFRAAYTIAHVGVVLGLLSALTFATVPVVSDGLGAGASAMAYQALAGHGLGFTVTLIFFGVHLLLLGVLIARSGYMPRLIGWLVVLAGLAYALDGFATVLLGSFGAFSGAAAIAVIVSTLIGEGALMIWLIAKGVNKDRFPA